MPAATAAARPSGAEAVAADSAANALPAIASAPSIAAMAGGQGSGVRARRMVGLLPKRGRLISSARRDHVHR
jgi:hypothetical protein